MIPWRGSLTTTWCWPRVCDLARACTCKWYPCGYATMQLQPDANRGHDCLCWNTASTLFSRYWHHISAPLIADLPHNPAFLGFLLQWTETWEQALGSPSSTSQPYLQFTLMLPGLLRTMRWHLAFISAYSLEPIHSISSTLQLNKTVNTADVGHALLHRVDYLLGKINSQQ
jgi:hypothetical protein